MAPEVCDGGGRAGGQRVGVLLDALSLSFPVQVCDCRSTEGDMFAQRLAPFTQTVQVQPSGKNKANVEVPKNLQSFVWPAGSAEISLKKTENDWLAIRRFMPLRTGSNCSVGQIAS